MLFLKVLLFYYCRTDIDPENPQHERYISELIGSFICEVENKANSLDGDELFLTRLKLIEAASFFKVIHCCEIIF